MSETEPKHNQEKSQEQKQPCQKRTLTHAEALLL